MTTEVWFRNPHNYVRELAEVGAPYRVAWDRGILVKKHIDPHKHAQMYFGEHSDWRILCIGSQGSAELDPEHDLTNPRAVYPTWAHGENLDILEELMANNIGLDATACTSVVPVDERPVPNQEHRVVVTNLPNIQQSANRSFFRELKTLQEDYPDCILHIHGTYSFRVLFGHGYSAGDVEPRGDAANGRVILPNGKIVAYARTIGTPQWVNLLGFSVTDLKEPRNRCMFNIKSAQWAGEHWNENIKFQSRGSNGSVDPNSPNTVVPTTSATRGRVSLMAEEGDKITCDTCSLASTCKYFRTGAVCSLPDSEMNTLGKMFNTRDSDQVIGALGALLGASSKRLEKGITDEEEFGELDPEVTKIINQLFTNGIKYAKLIDPSLAKPGVQVNVGGIPPNGGNSRQLTAAVVHVLEKQGIARADITPEMLIETLKEMGVEEKKPAQIVQGGVE